MPPKASTIKKAQEKKAAKVIEDKTFGLKNKNKSKSVQKFIKGVESQVSGNKAAAGVRSFEEKERLKKEEEARKLEQSLFKAVVQQKAPVGVDPKSVICEFFKKGMCTKGDKCKYSHNLEVERKSQKIDIYTDRRDDGKEEEKKSDTMENWDQNKLETVVTTKHGKESVPNRSKTVCKYFLQAIEEKKYGWFWECPNGGDKCVYQHCLPPGYVLKVQKKAEDEDGVEPQPIEEIIEEARAALTKRTPLTKEIFLKWKEDKKLRKEAEEKEKREKRDSEVKSGKQMRSGKEMFEFNPDLFVDEEDVMDTNELQPEAEDDEPIITIDVTGTSIRTTVTQKGEHEEVDESLFNEEEIPEDDE